MMLLGPLPAVLDDVTDEWASTPVEAWVTSDGPVMRPRVQASDGVAATGAQARALVERIAWDTLRAERNARLAATDFRVMADAPWDLAPWLAYRHALRDMPETTTDPLAPSWPTEPT
jgi:hypothetical protein